MHEPEATDPADLEALWYSAKQFEKAGTLTTGFGRLPGMGGDRRVFVYPDLHFPSQDKAFLAYLDEECDKYAPTDIVLIGDLLDCYSCSDFDKDPARKETLNDERNTAVAWLRERRAANRSARIRYVTGNHELRIRRQIKRYLPGLHDLPELTIPSLLKFDKLRIEAYDDMGFVDFGMRFKHGESAAKYSAAAEMAMHRRDGISGHCHREQHSTFVDKEGHKTTWWSVGHACDMGMVDYTKKPNWTLHTLSIAVSPEGDREYVHYTG